MTSNDYRVTGPWRLSDLRAGRVGAPSNGLRVFSTFACGGGSTMGYKLAGYEMVGCCEIDKEMAEIYSANHKPPELFLMPVQEMARLPEKNLEPLMGLDILDGSPPCSSFSMCGSREDAWGKEKKFREGQAEQRLDDLFFHFIALGKRLQPKVIVAENVKGLVSGNARGYVKEIFRALDEAGYDAQLFLLNSSRMGVPQRRERTFFLARRKDLGLPEIRLEFNEPEIPVSAALEGVTRTSTSRSFNAGNAEVRGRWMRAKPGQDLALGAKDNRKYFNSIKLSPSRPSNTVAAGSVLLRWDEFRVLNDGELIRLQSFPEDYDFLGRQAQYVIGMSVPPLMMQRIALEIGSQWLRRSP